MTLNVIRRGLMVLTASVVIVVIMATVALADCHVDGVNSGSGITHVGAAGSKQTMTWNLGNRTTSVKSEAGLGLSMDECLDASTDWMTESDHYDSRVARTCKPGAKRNGSVTEPPGWNGRTVTGLNKAAGCRFEQYPPSYGTCDYLTESGPWNECPFHALPWNDNTRMLWLRRQNGDTDLWSGGDPIDPDN